LFRSIPLLIFTSLLGAQGVLSIPAPSCDLGRIPPGRTVTRPFLVKNLGQGPLRILKLVPSCGCTTAKGAPQTLAPGGEATLEVVLNPAGFRGRIQKTVQVQTDQADVPVQVLTLGAEVVPPIVASANQIVFDDVSREGGGRAEIRLETQTAQPVTILDIQAPPYLGVVVRKEGRHAVLEVTLEGSRVPRDRWRGSDALQVRTRHAEAGPLVIQVLWTMEGQGR